MREADFSILPTKVYRGKNCYDWINSIGREIKFNYEGEIGKLRIINYIHKTNDTKAKIVVQYQDNLHTMTPNDLLLLRLGVLLKIIVTDYKYTIDQNITDENMVRDMTIINRYKDKRKKYDIICNKCKQKSYGVLESNLDKGSGCKYCGGTYGVLIGINDFASKAPELVKFFPHGISQAQLYRYNSNQKIIFKCPDCGKLKEYAINNLYYKHSIGCKCGDGKSYPEKFMNEVLHQLNVNYIWGFKEEWLRGYNGSKNSAEFDFCLEELKIVYEMDGGLGHNKKTHSNSNITTEETKDKDDWKDEQARKHGYKVIRIDADKSKKEYLKEKITNAIGGLYDLNNVNWDKCNEFALKNLVREVCEFRENNKHMTTKEIGEEFKLCGATIWGYLKRGKEVGWSTYSVDEAIKQRKIKAGIHAKTNYSKKIGVYKDDIFIAEYPSVSELARRSYEDFGVKFDPSLISMVAIGKRSHYKGYTFKYIL